MLLVFGATAYRIKRKAEGKPLIRWRENEDARQVFKEWYYLKLIINQYKNGLTNHTNFI